MAAVLVQALNGPTHSLIKNALLFLFMDVDIVRGPRRGSTKD